MVAFIVLQTFSFQIQWPNHGSSCITVKNKPVSSPPAKYEENDEVQLQQFSFLGLSDLVRVTSEFGEVKNFPQEIFFILVWC